VVTNEDDLPAALHRAGAQLIVRGWLSANNVVFADPGSLKTTVVDTGYFCHAEQTVQLVERALRGRALDDIVNTHLHSDHCGGNRALQDRFAGATIATPAGFRHAVEPWDEARLSFQDTGQRCPPFRVDRFIEPGDALPLGSADWEVHAAPGHDPDALMFYEPRSRILISGDALWERRLAIIFPELAGDRGFDAAHRTLDAIEGLDPRWVLPGHGPAFGDVAGALRHSRERIDLFAAQPRRHREHAARALAVFHMLEMRTLTREQLEAWMVATPVFRRTLDVAPEMRAATISAHSSEYERRQVSDECDLMATARQVVDSLVHDHILIVMDGKLALVAQ
jgi:glyoxylase-like metal-dependent hydrolase (beta-lactamase superfamily II)